MAIHLGRFTINTGSTDTIRNIRLTSPIDNEIYFTGPRYNNPEGRFGFQPKAVLHCNGEYKGASDLWFGDHNAIGPKDLHLQGTITIDFFLISHESASVFLSKGSYSHNEGFIGSFGLGYSTGPLSWDTVFDPFKNENGETQSDIHFLGPGMDVPEEDIDYDNPPDIKYDLTIQEQSEGFILSHAIGVHNKALVAQAQLTVSHLPVNSNHSIDLSFTSTNDSSQFVLSQKLNGTNHTIPYSLVFGTTPVVPGENVRWSGLHNGLQINGIYVTNIPALAAETALSGVYQDTINVQITPVDTI